MNISTLTYRHGLTASLRTLRIGPDHPKTFLNFTSLGGYTLVFWACDGEGAHPQCVADNLKDALARGGRERFVACQTYDEGPTARVPLLRQADRVELR